jgi:hypothetical protein
MPTLPLRLRGERLVSLGHASAWREHGTVPIVVTKAGRRAAPAYHHSQLAELLSPAGAVLFSRGGAMRAEFTAGLKPVTATQRHLL